MQRFGWPTMHTLDELYAAFTELCGVPQPNATREELDESFRAWCAERAVPADYAAQAAVYLADMETPGPADFGWP